MILAFLPQATAEILEIIATVTFIIYLVLQVYHSRYMWLLYIPSCVCAALNFFNSATWAFAALNIYYVVMGVVGIVRWKRDREKYEGHGKAFLLHRLPLKVVIISAAAVVVLCPALYFLLKVLADPNPFLDAITTTLSIIGTVWLTRSYIQQWWIWIVADIFAIWMNVNLGNTWFVIQFAFCIASSFLGLYNWNRRAQYVD